MSFLSTILLSCVLQTGVDEELSRLHEREQKIIDQTQSLEIDTSQARRKVQLLLKDLQQWAEDSDVELASRKRTYGAPATEMDEPLTADRCPLFFEFEEDLGELCPLDFARSEVWGGEVVFCRYRCAP